MSKWVALIYDYHLVYALLCISPVIPISLNTLRFFSCFTWQSAIHSVQAINCFFYWYQEPWISISVRINALDKCLIVVISFGAFTLSQAKSFRIKIITFKNDRLTKLRRCESSALQMIPDIIDAGPILFT